MPGIAWFASFIFLGLSISIGLLVYLLLYRKKRKREDSLPPELEEYDPKKKETTLEELERTYGKRG